MKETASPLCLVFSFQNQEEARRFQKVSFFDLIPSLLITILSVKFCMAPEEINAAKLRHPALISKPISFPASSGQAGRPQAGERPAKESSKAKKNRTIKISKISSVSQNWRASMVREIANANELKHLDEFLLNKVKGTMIKFRCMFTVCVEF